MKKFICTICIFSVILISLYAFNINNNKDNLNDNVITTSSHSFGIMIENDEGEYVEYKDGNTWPTSYIFNESMSYCVDENNNSVTATIELTGDTAIVTGNTQAYCKLYFRKASTNSSLETIEILDQDDNLIGTCEDTLCDSYKVGSDVTAFKIKVTASDSSSTFVFSGSTTVHSLSGTSSAYSLTAGVSTTKYVTVTAEDGSNTSYTIKVYKKNNDSTLSSIGNTTGSWTSTCSGSTTSCTLEVSNSTTSVTLTPKANDSNATLSTTSIDVSGLVVGNTTTKKVTVTSEDESSTTTYTINVYRKKSSDASISSISILSSSGSTLQSCTASSSSCNYNAEYSTTSYKIYVKTTDSSAKIKFTSSSATSSSYTGSATSSAYALTAGSTSSIIVTITAADGTTTKTYIVNVKREYGTLSDIVLMNENGSSTVSAAKSYISSKGTPSFYTAATYDMGLYAASDNYGTSYYFRGAVTDNYVYFAGYYWRIIRINGDGSVRMIYDGTASYSNGVSSTDRYYTTSTFNTATTGNTYVGYMYGTARASSYNAEHSNSYNSTIKGILDTWYKTYISNKTDTSGNLYSSYVSDTLFCNDRSIYSGSGYASSSTYYASYNRLINYKSPVLTCSSKSDRFTVSNTTYGNAKLTYPVGLITADEAAMAGAVYGTNNTSFYLYNGYAFWTMTAFGYLDNYYWGQSSYYTGSYFAGNWGVTPYGSINGSRIDGVYGVRPVINLSSSVLVTSGAGTVSNPYKVALS